MTFNSPFLCRILGAAAACLCVVSCEKEVVVARSGGHGGQTSLAGPEPAKIQLPEKISFNEHVQPVLSEYCYHCHGPDSGTREPKSAPLRLDMEKEAFAAREDGKPVIVKGKPGESRLVQLIHEKDPEKIRAFIETAREAQARIENVKVASNA